MRQLVNEYPVQSSTSVNFPIAQNVNMEYATMELLRVPVRIYDGENIRFGAYLIGVHMPERIILSDYI